MTRYPILLSPSRRHWRRTKTPFCPRRRRPWRVPWYWWGTSSWTPRYSHQQRNRQTVGGILSRLFCGISCAKMFDSHTSSKLPFVINRHFCVEYIEYWISYRVLFGLSIKIACFEVEELGLKNNACIVSENATDLPFALEKWKPIYIPTWQAPKLARALEQSNAYPRRHRWVTNGYFGTWDAPPIPHQPRGGFFGFALFCLMPLQKEFSSLHAIVEMSFFQFSPWELFPWNV